ncbi:hypothetical protein [Gilvibacter sp.]|uniref:hypothetical protein n=1 Tax=Gilvibacter sp. TaxID=2729997 RepID=UPI003F4A0341
MIKQFLHIVLIIFGFQAQAQIESNPEPLEIEKRIDVGDKTGKEVMSCLSELFLLPGKMETEGEISENTTVYGEWTYNYYVSPNNTPAGAVYFKYEFKMDGQMLVARFFDFTHDPEDSEFEALGPVPQAWNEGVSAVFTQKQYKEIWYDISFNSSNLIRLAQKYCVNK